jgi:hypothetical protein
MLGLVCRLDADALHAANHSSRSAAGRATSTSQLHVVHLDAVLPPILKAFSLSRLLKEQSSHQSFCTTLRRPARDLRKPRDNRPSCSRDSKRFLVPSSIPLPCAVPYRKKRHHTAISSDLQHLLWSFARRACEQEGRSASECGGNRYFSRCIHLGVPWYWRQLVAIDGNVYCRPSRWALRMSGR